MVAQIGGYAASIVPVIASVVLILPRMLKMFFNHREACMQMPITRELALRDKEIAMSEKEVAMECIRAGVSFKNDRMEIGAAAVVPQGEAPKPIAAQPQSEVEYGEGSVVSISTWGHKPYTTYNNPARNE